MLMIGVLERLGVCYKQVLICRLEARDIYNMEQRKKHTTILIYIKLEGNGTHNELRKPASKMQ